MHKANGQPDFAMVSQRHQAGKKFFPLPAPRGTDQESERGMSFAFRRIPARLPMAPSNIWDSTVIRREGGAS
jgi:hypothetical protein